MPKQRKISDLSEVETNELLLKLDEFRSSLWDGDEDLPPGLVDKLEELRGKLRGTKVDSITILSLKISSGPLFLVDEKTREIENLGSVEPTGCISMETTRSLIRLVRGHVAIVTEAGCRILVNILLLRVVSVMCPGETTVNLIPEFALPRTTFKQDSCKYSFGGVVDFLVTKLPARYTEYLLGDPTTALANSEFIEGPMTSNVFLAKRDNVRATLPRAAIAAASYCQMQKLSTIRGVVTSGEQWVFFTYERRANETGLVRSSPEYSLGTNLEGLALVLGLLQDSIDNATSSEHAFFSPS